MKQQLVQLRLYEFNVIVKLFFLTPYLKVDYHFHDSYRIVILSTTRLNVKNFLELFYYQISYHPWEAVWQVSAEHLCWSPVKYSVVQFKI